MPELDVIAMLSKMAQDIMGVGGAGLDWAIRFMIGTVLWGALFAFL